MTNLVSRLRNWASWEPGAINRLCQEAADELDILQRENAALKETQEQQLLELQSLRPAVEPRERLAKLAGLNPQTMSPDGSLQQSNRPSLDLKPI